MVLSSLKGTLSTSQVTSNKLLFQYTTSIISLNPLWLRIFDNQGHEKLTSASGITVEFLYRPFSF